MKSRSNLELKIQLGIVLAIAVLAAGVLIYATSVAPWAGSDSVEYVEVARNFAAGHGLVIFRASGKVVPLSLRPPLLSIALGTFSAVGIGVMQASRWLNIILLASWVGGLGWLLTRKANLGWFGVTCATVLAVHPDVFEQFAGIMSEPLFLVLGTYGLVASYGAVARRSRSLFWGSVLLTAAALLARYAGVVFVLVGALIQLFRQKGSFFQRLLSALMYFGAAVAPFLLWTLSVRMAGGAPGTYAFQIDGLWRRLEPVRLALVNTLWKWIPFFENLSGINYRGKLYALAATLTTALVVLPIALILKRRQNGRSRDSGREAFIGLLFAGFGILYLLFITTTYLVVELPKPILDGRILMPGMLAMILSILFYIHRAVETLGSESPLRFLVLIFPILFVSFYAPATVSLAKELHPSGRGYSSAGWQNSCLIEAVRGIPPDRQIISDDIEGIMFHTGRTAYRIPDLQTGRSRPLDERLGDDPTDDVHSLFNEGKAVLVLFNSANVKFYGTYEEETEQRIEGLTGGLVECITACDGSVYAYDRESCP
jgi:hypothetical protein